MRADETKYSSLIPGNCGNYKLPVRFDISGSGYLGISQTEGGEVRDRVLLSPAQVAELLKFVGR